MTTIAPYGAWISPVTTELMTGASISLGSLSACGGALYWLEGRPTEGGRQALCRRSADGIIADVTPAPVNVGSRVHEYGGGAYGVTEGWIVYSERSDGSVWAIEGGAAPRKIATPDGCRYADFEFDLPRQRVFAVREDHRGRPPTDPEAAIVALSLAGAEEAVLIRGPDFLSSPRLSPDGQSLAWIAWDHPDMPWDRTQLFCAPLDGGGVGAPELIAGGGAAEAIVQPGWSPQNVLYFCSDRTGWWNLYAREDGADVALGPVEAEIGGPHWVFRQRFYAFFANGRIIVSVVQDGVRRTALIGGGALIRLDEGALDFGQVQDCPLPVGDGAAFIAATPTAPPAIMLKPALNAPALLVRAAAPSILPGETISVGAPIEFETPHGRGHAFWYAPKNRDFCGPDGALPPLVALTHGGPTSMTTNAFSLNVQWWTSRGVAVVDVNYGGSTGYGRPFRRLLNGAWGIVDVADCQAAAASLVERGLVDGARLAIRGGSAGGFTTLAALTSGDVFKAGASLYGVADLMLLARDTHKFESRYLDALIGPLPEAEALYAERSPINHLDKLGCPVIFFQGEEDRTVPPNQAEEMVAAMKARGLPVAYYLFAGEGHGFRKAETLRRVLELELDFYGRIFGFLAPGLSERVVIANS
ncbi:peptidase S9 prolyl oligopeptidase active site domain protein [Methylocella silvestris BL2]|uniref:Peptidase S9 prolyl oligopeptidase active site domain protein n=1 Tax=Methylocella silvestris (strain DSM 15510 / CIP 108128 / LMG 27833 / NCIMB 13906 / BL2) TaxID=395965 RepID=B8EI46_METSB|nr:S9 family peptidase [Methylocella silvestris]ACK50528.1 peptidase S9 prolyl oligopeptidase active site domain protein [Methylocella silvestris BL2]